MLDAILNAIEIATMVFIVVVMLLFLVIGGLIAAVVLRLPKRGRPRRANRKHWKRAQRGEGFGIDELAQRLGISAGELTAMSPKYSERFIDKRRGGVRRLLVPSHELKQLQQKILKRLLGRLNVHPAATGFEPGTSIVHHASRHTRQAVVVCLDIHDFFPCTTSGRITAYFQRIGWNREAAELLTTLTTWEDGLPQGAPTSPRLSNLVNQVLDARITRFVHRRQGTYSRYADDICISFPKDYPRRVRGTVQTVGRHLKAFGYQLNASKTRILRQHQQQKVTGLVVNDRANVPRHIRRKLRAVEHRLNTGQRATMTREQLNGWKALLTMVEQQREGA